MGSSLHHRLEQHVALQLNAAAPRQGRQGLLWMVAEVEAELDPDMVLAANREIEKIVAVVVLLLLGLEAAQDHAGRTKASRPSFAQCVVNPYSPGSPGGGAGASNTKSAEGQSTLSSSGWRGNHRKFETIVIASRRITQSKRGP